MPNKLCISYAHSKKGLKEQEGITGNETSMVQKWRGGWRESGENTNLERNGIGLGKINEGTKD